MWQNISFDKKVTKSSLLTVPAKFVRQHGDKFQKFITLQSELGGHLWTVIVTVAFPHGRPQVHFGRGWKKFVVFHGLVKGDRMTFTLVAKSKFKVSIARSSENFKHLQTLEMSRKDDSQRWPKRRRKKPLRSPNFADLTSEKLEVRLDECNESVAKESCEAVKTEIVVVRSNSNAAAAAASLSGSSDMDSHFFEPRRPKRRRKKLLRPPCFVDLTEKPEVRRNECNEQVAKDCGAVKAEPVAEHKISIAAATGSSLSGSSDMDSHFFEPVQAAAPLPFFYS